jgi:colanic acid/amylovoran biosynthesis protein
MLLRDEWINTPRQVDLILNCRGYYIADKWIMDDDSVSSLECFYKQFNKKGRRLIMLPQAIGPFENEYSKKAINIIYEQADMIYAREQQSYEYLSKVCSNTDKIKVVPDFTCLCQEEQYPSIQLPKKEYVLLIPNARMVDKTSANVSNSYLDFLIQIVSDLRELGENVYLLNHEGAGDEQLMHEINEKLDVEMPILTNLSGTEIKALIKNSKLLISARFHGVVSGLTQGVPTLCTSWSHKYGELLREHGCKSNMLEVNDISSSLKTIHEALAQPEKYSSKEGCEDSIENRVNQMWNEIFRSPA